MKNSALTLLILFISCISTLKAQITITSADFPHAGMLVVRDIDSTTAISPGPAGTGQMWDFSNLVPSYDDSTLYTMPGGQPGIQHYPNTNLVQKDLDSDISMDGGFNYIYYETKPWGWFVQGQELRISFWGIAIAWHMFYEPPAVTLPLPFTYNSSSNLSTTWKLYAASSVGGVMYDSALTVNHTNVSQHADASGTMITPEGSFEVLRVYQQTEITDSAFKYQAGAGWVFDNTGFTTLKQYTWYANGIGEVGSLLIDDKKRGGEFSFFKSSTIVGTDDADKEVALHLYPVPATDRINIESSRTINKAEIYNSTGTLLVSEMTNPSAIGISGLAPGIYILKAYTDTGVQVKKFLKQ